MSQTEQPIDPFKVMESVPITDDSESEPMVGNMGFSELREGDFVRPKSWSRPRVIVLAEENGEGRVYHLADPDHFPEYRKLTLPEFQNRSGWVCYPSLSRLYRGYQPPVVEALPVAPGSTGKVGTRKPFGGLL